MRSGRKDCDIDEGVIINELGFEASVRRGGALVFSTGGVRKVCRAERDGGLSLLCSLLLLGSNGSFGAKGLFLFVLRA